MICVMVVPAMPLPHPTPSTFAPDLFTRMYVKRPGPANYTKPVDLSELSVPSKDEKAGKLESVGATFTRHVMLHGTVTMTAMERLERNASRYGAYRRIDGIERHHHTPRPDVL